MSPSSGNLGDDSCNSIIESISFNNNRIIRVKCANMGAGEGRFEALNAFV